MTATPSLGDDWVPDACTLPTVDQPLRRAEFDDLFSHDVIAIHRESSRRVRLELRPSADVASRAAGLAWNETGCCAFFAFDLAIADSAVTMVIETGPAHTEILGALAARAESRMGARS